MFNPFLRKSLSATSGPILTGQTLKSKSIIIGVYLIFKLGQAYSKNKKKSIMTFFVKMIKTGLYGFKNVEIKL
jgi:hypothetical protein